ncbi:non-specific lipid-transfer protein [Striga asiatica]|uniref:Non-specific lipid-transfer protein n=1 Tax=Striga asiatica TaxID=4170 RepID=A0A5A7PES5_STRAF|nr:non-specific lipid-transfer protein [Striga asiatica]
MKRVLPVIVILAVLSLAVQPGWAVTCGQVDAALAPCISFLTGHADSPPPGCCAGVKTVKGLAQTTADKRACCSCVKTAAIRIDDLKDSAAQSLPTSCGVQLDIPVSRTVDCDK